MKNLVVKRKGFIDGNLLINKDNGCEYSEWAKRGTTFISSSASINIM